MIEKKTVCQIVEEWLEGKDYFLVEVTVSPDGKIVVEAEPIPLEKFERYGLDVLPR